MLHEINYYYQKSRESGISDLNCRIYACISNPITGKTKYWPEVKNYYDYIRKCYTIAQEVPVEDLRRKYLMVRFSGKESLSEVLQEVITALDILNEKDLNYMMGYTPICHVREQLNELADEISTAIKNCQSIPQVINLPKAPHAKKSFWSKLFG